MIEASLITLTLNLIGFIFGWFWQSDKLTDLIYSFSFFVVVGYLYQNSNQTITTLLLTAMIGLWALRLGSYLFWRINKMKKDTRFDNRRPNFLALLNFWILQTGSIIIILIPAIIFYSKPNGVLEPVQFIGIGIWLLGFLLESIADFQKSHFKSDPMNQGQFIQSGLWSVVRYPNYLGEILCWIGVFLFCSPVFVTGNWIAIVSPLWIIILLVFISGIPFLEKSSEKKYGSMPAFKSYVGTTKKLIPGVY